MQHDLESILKNAQFTDITLAFEGHTIKAHKAILAARSPVFAAMFSTDMEESRQNQVTITDMEYEVAQQLLQFIYTGKTDISPGTVDQLLVAADKYGLSRLKAQCEQTIFNTLAIPTAIKTLIFADRMNTQQLKSRTMKFIKTNMDKVVESADWKTMAVEHPTLLVEVCRALAHA
ncbi:speckle-type POZ protein B-like [Ochlerotatus camptorhynchus]|uniref:speckle-type POZ protein B-like n=1 Tax=Ochlerotatus camptorhynchus TaxID=644619 RepID=UPI0031DA8EEF